MNAKLRLSNIYRYKCYRVDGSLKWTDDIHNLLPTASLQYVMQTLFPPASPPAHITTWYCGLINNANFSALAVGDTAAKITTGVPSGATNGWREWISYSGAARPLLTLGAFTAGAADNSASLASYTMTAAGTLKGGFIVSSITLGGVLGLLYGEGAFDDSMTHAVTNGETVTMEVFVSGASG